MSRFRRRDKNADAIDPDIAADDASPGRDDAEYDDGASPRAAPPARTSGPWDASEIDDPAAGGRVNMGGMWIPTTDGLEVQVQVDEASQGVIAVTLLLDGGALQLQPFAAPRNEGIWDEIRAEIRSGITSDGGTSDEVEGPLGTELHTRAQVRAPDGKSAVEPARFIGVDGPRWFLRGVLTGAPAAAPRDDDVLLTLMRDVVVVRGTGPMAPRELIPLRLPDQAHDAPAEAAEEDPLSPFERGPEITEIH